MIICSNCGHTNEAGAQFCANPECGVFLEWYGEATQELQKPEEPQARKPQEVKPAGPKTKPDQQGQGVSLALDDEVVHADPGSEGGTGIRVRNTGQIVEQFTLEIGGPAGAWAVVDPPTFSLFPNAEGSARVWFRPPRSSAVAPGPHDFVVNAVSTVNAAVRARENGTVDVGRFIELSANLLPQHAEGRFRTTHRLVLRNHGNTPVRANLTAGELDEATRVDLAPSVLELGPDGQATATVTVRVRGRRARDPRTRHPFSVRVDAEGHPPLTVEGTTAQGTSFPKWIVPAVAALGALALASTLLLPLFASPQLQPTPGPTQPPPTIEPTQPSPPPEPGPSPPTPEPTPPSPTPQPSPSPPTPEPIPPEPMLLRFAGAAEISVATRETETTGPPIREARELIDGDVTTVWRTPGDGSNVQFVLAFDRAVQLRRIGLLPGNAQPPSPDGATPFIQDRTVTSVRYTFDDGTPVEVDLAPEPTMQFIDVNVVTQIVRVEILSTTEPGANDFTAISEVQAYGFPS